MVKKEEKKSLGVSTRQILDDGKRPTIGLCRYLVSDSVNFRYGPVPLKTSSGT